MNEATPEPRAVAERKRFHFSLRTLLILLTVVCLALGLGVSRYNAAARAVENRRAVMAAILESRLNPPAGLAISRADTLGVFAKPKADIERWFHFDGLHTMPRKQRAFFDGRSLGTSTLGCKYDLEDAAARLKPAVIRGIIHDHYAESLEATGVFESGHSELNASGGDWATCRMIWSVGGNEIVAVLDIEVMRDPSKASVRVLVIESQSIGWW